MPIFWHSKRQNWCLTFMKWTPDQNTQHTTVLKIWSCCFCKNICKLLGLFIPSHLAIYELKNFQPTKLTKIILSTASIILPFF